MISTECVLIMNTFRLNIHQRRMTNYINEIETAIRGIKANHGLIKYVYFIVAITQTFASGESEQPLCNLLCSEEINYERKTEKPAASISEF